MSELKVLRKNALNAYRKADEKGKNLLAELLGKENFSDKITDQVKTFEDACETVGISADYFPEPNEVVEDEKAADAYRRLRVIAKALNEGWKPDWNNDSQLKYFNWFKWNGTGFSFNNTDHDYRFTNVGSRLCFKNAELARYAATQFADIYNTFLTH